mgnify:CR=1 FL=1
MGLITRVANKAGALGGIVSHTVCVELGSLPVGHWTQGVPSVL